MGLREMNATRTRRHLGQVALDLFLDQGYDATTMEEVAARAEVGLSTLYRYFPTKESLATMHLGDTGLMAALLTERPADEPIEIAIGETVVAFLDQTDQGATHSRRFRDLLQSNGRVAAGVVEWLMESQLALARAIAERRGLRDADLDAAATAWMSVFVLQRAAEDDGVLDGQRSASAAAIELMRDLAGTTVPIPSTAR